jgi:hypothetical protein
MPNAAATLVSSLLLPMTSGSAACLRARKAETIVRGIVASPMTKLGASVDVGPATAMKRSAGTARRRAALACAPGRPRACARLTPTPRALSRVWLGMP